MYYFMNLIFSLPNKVIVNTITSVSNIKHFYNPSAKIWESLFKFSSKKFFLKARFNPPSCATSNFRRLSHSNKKIPWNLDQSHDTLNWANWAKQLSIQGFCLLILNMNYLCWPISTHSWYDKHWLGSVRNSLSSIS